MGCDIHAMVEVKVDPYGHAKEYPGAAWWLSGGEVFIHRNYELFTRLANVRNYTDPAVVPIAEPRGLPENLSGPMHGWANAWGPDGHSHSWASLSEVATPTGSDHLNEGLTTILKHMLAVKMLYNASDVRLVFFFDN